MVFQSWQQFSDGNIIPVDVTKSTRYKNPSIMALSFQINWSTSKSSILSVSKDPKIFSIEEHFSFPAVLQSYYFIVLRHYVSSDWQLMRYTPNRSQNWLALLSIGWGYCYNNLHCSLFVKMFTNSARFLKGPLCGRLNSERRNGTSRAELRIMRRADRAYIDTYREAFVMGQETDSDEGKTWMWEAGKAKVADWRGRRRGKE